MKSAKRVVAIVVAVLMIIGMVGLFFPAFQYVTAPATTATPQ